MSQYITIKHQAYRCDGREVVLDHTGQLDLDSEGRPTRTKTWFVREISIVKGEYVLGQPYEVPANSLSLMGRAIPIQERT